jgi:hypothetical protein
MHTLFFGGMSQFTLDAQNNLVEDVDVPFVKTISKVTRFSNGSLQEAKLDYIEMPTLVGSGSEFIPAENYFLPREILDLNAVPSTKTLIGYIYGGIESTQDNIFFINDGTQSSASNVIFKVYINKSTASNEEIVLSGDNVLQAEIYPVPAKNKLTVSFNAPRPGECLTQIIDGTGRVVKSETLTATEMGLQEFTLNINKLEKGTYTLVLNYGIHQLNKTFVKD